MGIVTTHLFHLIAKQVEDHRLVVWYDPEQVYSAVVEELVLPTTTMARYDGSFFQLRHDIDAPLNDEQPHRLVVYVPEERGNTHHVLIELEAAGVIIQPGQQPPQRNTRLALIARNALKPILGEETASEIEKQVEAGKLSLADLNTLADKGQDISNGQGQGEAYVYRQGQSALPVRRGHCYKSRSFMAKPRQARRSV